MPPSSGRIFSASWRLIAILALLRQFGLFPPRHTAYIHAIPTEPGFIAAGNSETPQQPHTVEGRIQSKTIAIRTAKDAAMALNTIPFIEMLVGMKNSAHVKTFTRSVETMSGEHLHNDKRSATKPAMESSLASRNLFRRLFSANGIVPATDDESTTRQHRGRHRCTSPPPSSASRRWMFESSPCPSHETVAEYIGRLWFINNNYNNDDANKNGIKFRETIKVVSLSHDGTTATVECHTEYYNGSAWVSCCKITCEFSSAAPSGEERDGEEGRAVDFGVKMTLECDLLVWLPLPGSASRAVRRKIGSVFESVALDFLDERARIGRRRHG